MQLSEIILCSFLDICNALKCRDVIFHCGKFKLAWLMAYEEMGNWREPIENASSE